MGFMKLLFLYTHNACRSILAEVITRRLVGNRIQVASAGSQPAGRIHPLTLEQLEKHQFSAQGLTSKSWNDLVKLLTMGFKKVDAARKNGVSSIDLT